MSTIGTQVTIGITLGTVASTGTYLSPLTITTSGAVDAATGTAVYGPNTRAWTVVNEGGITASGSGGYGIDLLAGGSVVNSGTISAYDSPIVISGSAGTVSNSGTIIGTGTLVGTIGDGVALEAGGGVFNTATAGLIEGYNNGVYITGTVGTVTNSGTIEGTGTFTSDGVNLSAGGGVSNATAGLIEGYAAGVFVAGAGTVANSGTITITGTSGDGVSLVGGSVGNTGLIAGYGGIEITGAAGTVTNSGTIDGTAAGSLGIGIVLRAGGSVGNTATAGLILGYSGVSVYGDAGTVTNFGTVTGSGAAGLGINLAAGGTVIDSGTIGGASGTAVYFGGTGGNLLVLERGYSLGGGTVVGSGSATNTLELGGSLSAPLTAGYTALRLTNFSDVLFGAGGNDTLTVAGTVGTLPVQISGFTLTSDIIDLTQIGTNGTIVGTVGTTVTITGSLGSETLKLDGSDVAVFKLKSDGGTGTDIGVPCFCAGALILTEKGEVAVEALAIGDRVMTLAGAVRPVKWIGRRVIAVRFADPLLALPVCVRAGALAGGVPRRDLRLSPDHALLIDGVLIQAGALVNGSSVVRDTDLPETITYYHIELAGHDLVIAEGASAESFVDNVERMGFDNWAEHRALYGEEPPIAELDLPRAKSHRQVPLLTRTRLAARARLLYPLAAAAA